MTSIAILAFYRGHHVRGVERWATDIQRHLSDHGTVTIFQNGPKDQFDTKDVVSIGLEYRDTSPNTILKKLFLDYYSRRVWWFAIAVVPHLFRNSYDIVLPTDGGWEPALIRIVCWLTGKKMVIVGHAGIGRDDANNVWSFPDVFVAISSYAERWAKKINPFVKTCYIPDGVDLSVFMPKTKKKRRKKQLLVVGALTVSKRIDLIIKAVAHIPDAELTIVGSGEQKNNLTKLAIRELPARCHFITASFSEMPDIYASADLLLSASEPSYSFEMVLIEAMACGIGVVANDDPIRREIVGDAGLFADPTDVQQYSMVVQSALEKTWSRVARAQAERYSWKNISRMYRKLFDSMMV